MSNIRNHRVTIRFSEEEYQKLIKKVTDNNMDIANYIRERILFDSDHIEDDSFEYKVLKGISYCVGAIATISDLKLNDKEKISIEEEVIRIMRSNGLKIETN